MDISKAFDKVSRLLLMKKLIKRGIGKCMFRALKQLYKLTNCIIKFNGVFSNIFPMSSGIRQGAASSVLLFNVFIDDLFEYLRNNCTTETLLQDIHALIHADDTIIVSTNKQKFIHKCNLTMKFFQENKLKLNMGKCKYIVINRSIRDKKESLVLEGGTLKYTDSLKYLGVYITSDGLISKDVKHYLSTVRPTISLKFTNFCNLNKNAPLHVKLDVLDKCAVPALLYACEVWGRCFHEAEAIYRCGIKSALGVRQSTNNEIVYIEAGRHPLECKIKSLQHKFWGKITTYVMDYPEAAIAKILRLEVSQSLQYVKYYNDLVTKFSNFSYCEMSIEAKFRAHWRNIIVRKAEIDPDSKLGTYLRVNPELKPFVPFPQNIMEGERKLITRFRTGSHSLAIELGRFSNTPRPNRLCKCKVGVQTVWHVFNECPLTKHIHRNRFNVLKEVFIDPELSKLLLRITSLLKVPI